MRISDMRMSKFAVGLEFFQGLEGVGGQLAFVAFVLQKIAQQFADVFFVVGDQYSSLCSSLFQYHIQPTL